MPAARLCGGTHAGTKITSSSPNNFCTRRATFKWPLCTGSNVPPYIAALLDGITEAKACARRTKLNRQSKSRRPAAHEQRFVRARRHAAVVIHPQLVELARN